MSALGRKQRRDLARRRWQFGAAALTIVLGTMSYAASYDAYRNMAESYRRTHDRLGLADATVTGADDGFAAGARDLRDVGRVETRRQADVPIRIGRTTFMGRVVEIPIGRRWHLNRLDVLEGRDVGGEERLVGREERHLGGAEPRLGAEPRSSIGGGRQLTVGGRDVDPSTPDPALVETHSYDHFRLQPGDRVHYFDGTDWRALAVAGSALSAEYLWPARNSQEIMTTPDSFGVLFVDGSVLDGLDPVGVEHQVLIGYRRGAVTEGADAAVRRAARRAGATSVVVRAEQPSTKALSADLLSFQQMAYAFPALFLVAAALGAWTLLTRLVYQERELIGTLRANGLTRTAVARHYLTFGLWLGAISGALGVVVGLPLGWLLTGVYTTELGIPDTVRELRWTTVAVGVAFGAVTGIVSAWLPARTAARLDPAEAMRGEVAASPGGRSPVEHLLPRGALSPASLLVLRGIGRNRRRSLATVLGVVLALVLMMAAWGLLDSTNWLIREQFGRVQREDASVVFTGQVDERAADRVRDVRGVEDAEVVVALPVTVRAGGEWYATQLMAFDARTAMHGFDPELPSDGILLGDRLREQHGLDEGDRVLVTVPHLGTDLSIRVDGFVDEPLGSVAYMRRDALVEALAAAEPPVGEEQLATPSASLVMARFRSGVDREMVMERLRELDGVATASDSLEFLLLMEEYMGLFYLFVGIMLAFGGALGVALLVNTMSTNLSERAGELATMRANGVSRRQVARLVVRENLLLALLGTPIGLVAGYLTSWALMSSYETDMYAFELHFEPLTFVWSVAAVVLVTLASLWPSLRAVERMDVASIVRQRSL